MIESRFAPSSTGLITEDGTTGSTTTPTTAGTAKHKGFSAPVTKRHAETHVMNHNSTEEGTITRTRFNTSDGNTIPERTSAPTRTPKGANITNRSLKSMPAHTAAERVIYDCIPAPTPERPGGKTQPSHDIGNLNISTDYNPTTGRTGAPTAAETATYGITPTPAPIATGTNKADNAPDSTPAHAAAGTTIHRNCLIPNTAGKVESSPSTQANTEGNTAAHADSVAGSTGGPTTAATETDTIYPTPTTTETNTAHCTIESLVARSVAGNATYHTTKPRPRPEPRNTRASRLPLRQETTTAPQKSLNSSNGSSVAKDNNKPARLAAPLATQTPIPDRASASASIPKGANTGNGPVDSRPAPSQVGPADNTPPTHKSKNPNTVTHYKSTAGRMRVLAVAGTTTLVIITTPVHITKGTNREDDTINSAPAHATAGTAIHGNTPAPTTAGKVESALNTHDSTMESTAAHFDKAAETNGTPTTTATANNATIPTSTTMEMNIAHCSIESSLDGVAAGQATYFTTKTRPATHLSATPATARTTKYESLASPSIAGNADSTRKSLNSTGGSSATYDNDKPACFAAPIAARTPTSDRASAYPTTPNRANTEKDSWPAPTPAGPTDNTPPTHNSTNLICVTDYKSTIGRMSAPAAAGMATHAIIIISAHAAMGTNKKDDSTNSKPAHAAAGTATDGNTPDPTTAGKIERALTTLDTVTYYKSTIGRMSAPAVAGKATLAIISISVHVATGINIEDDTTNSTPAQAAAGTATHGSTPALTKAGKAERALNTHDNTRESTAAHVDSTAESTGTPTTMATATDATTPTSTTAETNITHRSIESSLASATAGYATHHTTTARTATHQSTVSATSRTINLKSHTAIDTTGRKKSTPKSHINMNESPAANVDCKSGCTAALSAARTPTPETTNGPKAENGPADSMPSPAPEQPDEHTPPTKETTNSSTTGSKVTPTSAARKQAQSELAGTTARDATNYYITVSTTTCESSTSAKNGATTLKSCHTTAEVGQPSTCERKEESTLAKLGGTHACTAVPNSARITPHLDTAAPTPISAEAKNETCSVVSTENRATTKTATCHSTTERTAIDESPASTNTRSTNHESSIVLTTEGPADSTPSRQNCPNGSLAAKHICTTGRIGAHTAARTPINEKTPTPARVTTATHSKNRLLESTPTLAAAGHTYYDTTAARTTYGKKTSAPPTGRLSYCSPILKKIANTSAKYNESSRERAEAGSTIKGCSPAPTTAGPAAISPNTQNSTKGRKATNHLSDTGAPTTETVTHVTTLSTAPRTPELNTADSTPESMLACTTTGNEGNYTTKASSENYGITASTTAGAATRMSRHTPTTAGHPTTLGRSNENTPLNSGSTTDCSNSPTTAKTTTEDETSRSALSSAKVNTKNCSTESTSERTAGANATHQTTKARAAFQESSAPATTRTTNHESPAPPTNAGHIVTTPINLYSNNGSLGASKDRTNLRTGEPTARLTTEEGTSTYDPVTTETNAGGGFTENTPARAATTRRNHGATTARTATDESSSSPATAELIGSKPTLQGRTNDSTSVNHGESTLAKKEAGKEIHGSTSAPTTAESAGNDPTWNDRTTDSTSMKNGTTTERTAVPSTAGTTTPARIPASAPIPTGASAEDGSVDSTLARVAKGTAIDDNISNTEGPDRSPHTDDSMNPSTSSSHDRRTSTPTTAGTTIDAETRTFAPSTTGTTKNKPAHTAAGTVIYETSGPKPGAPTTEATVTSAATPISVLITTGTNTSENTILSTSASAEAGTATHETTTSRISTHKSGVSTEAGTASQENISSFTTEGLAKGTSTTSNSTAGCSAAHGDCPKERTEAPTMAGTAIHEISPTSVPTNRRTNTANRTTGTSSSCAEASTAIYESPVPTATETPDSAPTTQARAKGGIRAIHESRREGTSVPTTAGTALDGNTLHRTTEGLADCTETAKDSLNQHTAAQATTGPNAAENTGSTAACAKSRTATRDPTPTDKATQERIALTSAGTPVKIQTIYDSPKDNASGPTEAGLIDSPPDTHDSTCKETPANHGGKKEGTDTTSKAETATHVIIPTRQEENARKKHYSTNGSPAAKLDSKSVYNAALTAARTSSPEMTSAPDSTSNGPNSGDGPAYSSPALTPEGPGENKPPTHKSTISPTKHSTTGCTGAPSEAGPVISMIIIITTPIPLATGMNKADCSTDSWTAYAAAETATHGNSPAPSTVGKTTSTPTTQDRSEESTAAHGDDAVERTGVPTLPMNTAYNTTENAPPRAVAGNANRTTTARIATHENATPATAKTRNHGSLAAPAMAGHANSARKRLNSTNASPVANADSKAIGTTAPTAARASVPVRTPASASTSNGAENCPADSTPAPLEGPADGNVPTHGITNLSPPPWKQAQSVPAGAAAGDAINYTIKASTTTHESKASATNGVTTFESSHAPAMTGQPTTNERTKGSTAANFEGLNVRTAVPYMAGTTTHLATSAHTQTTAEANGDNGSVVSTGDREAARKATCQYRLADSTPTRHNGSYENPATKRDSTTGRMGASTTTRTATNERTPTPVLITNETRTKNGLLESSPTLTAVGNKYYETTTARTANGKRTAALTTAGPLDSSLTLYDSTITSTSDNYAEGTRDQAVAGTATKGCTPAPTMAGPTAITPTTKDSTSERTVPNCLSDTGAPRTRETTTHMTTPTTAPRTTEPNTADSKSESTFARNIVGKESDYTTTARFGNYGSIASTTVGAATRTSRRTPSAAEHPITHGQLKEGTPSSSEGTTECSMSPTTGKTATHDGTAGSALTYAEGNSGNCSTGSTLASAADGNATHPTALARAASHENSAPATTRTANHESLSPPTNAGHAENTPTNHNSNNGSSVYINDGTTLRTGAPTARMAADERTSTCVSVTTGMNKGSGSTESTPARAATRPRNHGATTARVATDKSTSAPTTAGTIGSTTTLHGRTKDSTAANYGESEPTQKDAGMATRESTSALTTAGPADKNARTTEYTTNDRNTESTTECMVVPPSAGTTTPERTPASAPIPSGENTGDGSIDSLHARVAVETLSYDNISAPTSEGLDRTPPSHDSTNPSTSTSDDRCTGTAGITIDAKTPTLVPTTTGTTESKPARAAAGTATHGTPRPKPDAPTTTGTASHASTPTFAPITRETNTSENTTESTSVCAEAGTAKHDTTTARTSTHQSSVTAAGKTIQEYVSISSTAGPAKGTPTTHNSTVGGSEAHRDCTMECTDAPKMAGKGIRAIIPTNERTNTADRTTGSTTSCAADKTEKHTPIIASTAIHESPAPSAAETPVCASTTHARAKGSIRANYETLREDTSAPTMAGTTIDGNTSARTTQGQADDTTTANDSTNQRTSANYESADDHKWAPAPDRTTTGKRTPIPANASNTADSTIESMAASAHTRTATHDPAPTVTATLERIAPTTAGTCVNLQTIYDSTKESTPADPANADHNNTLEPTEAGLVDSTPDTHDSKQRGTPANYGCTKEGTGTPTKAETATYVITLTYTRTTTETNTEDRTTGSKHAQADGGTAAHVSTSAHTMTGSYSTTTTNDNTKDSTPANSQSSTHKCTAENHDRATECTGTPTNAEIKIPEITLTSFPTARGTNTAGSTLARPTAGKVTYYTTTGRTAIFKNGASTTAGAVTSDPTARTATHESTAPTATEAPVATPTTYDRAGGDTLAKYGSAPTTSGNSIHVSVLAQTNKGPAGSTDTKHDRTNLSKAAQNNGTAEYTSEPTNTVNATHARTPTSVPTTTGTNAAEDMSESEVACAEHGTALHYTTNAGTAVRKSIAPTSALYESTSTLTTEGPANCTSVTHNNETGWSATKGDSSIEHNDAPTEVRTETPAQLTTVMKTFTLVKPNTEMDKANSTVEGTHAYAIARTEQPTDTELTTASDLTADTRNTADLPTSRKENITAMEMTSGIPQSDLDSNSGTPDWGDRGSNDLTMTRGRTTQNQDIRGEALGRKPPTITGISAGTLLTGPDSKPEILETTGLGRHTRDTTEPFENSVGSLKSRKTTAQTKLTNHNVDARLHTLHDYFRGTAEQASFTTGNPNSTRTTTSAIDSRITAEPIDTSMEPLTTAGTTARATRVCLDWNPETQATAALTRDIGGTDVRVSGGTEDLTNRELTTEITLTDLIPDFEIRKRLGPDRDAHGKKNRVEFGSDDPTTAETTARTSLTNPKTHQETDEPERVTGRTTPSVNGTHPPARTETQEGTDTSNTRQKLERHNLHGKDREVSSANGLTVGETSAETHPTSLNSNLTTQEAPELNHGKRGASDEVGCVTEYRTPPPHDRTNPSTSTNYDRHTGAPSTAETATGARTLIRVPSRTGTTEGKLACAAANTAINGAPSPQPGAPTTTATATSEVSTVTSTSGPISKETYDTTKTRIPTHKSRVSTAAETSNQKNLVIPTMAGPAIGTPTTHKSTPRSSTAHRDYSTEHTGEPTRAGTAIHARTPTSAPTYKRTNTADRTTGSMPSCAADRTEKHTSTTARTAIYESPAPTTVGTPVTMQTIYDSARESTPVDSETLIYYDCTSEPTEARLVDSTPDTPNSTNEGGVQTPANYGSKKEGTGTPSMATTATQAKIPTYAHITEKSTDDSRIGCTDARADRGTASQYSTPEHSTTGSYSTTTTNDGTKESTPTNHRSSMHNGTAENYDRTAKRTRETSKAGTTIPKTTHSPSPIATRTNAPDSTIKSTLARPTAGKATLYTATGQATIGESLAPATERTATRDPTANTAIHESTAPTSAEAPVDTPNIPVRAIEIALANYGSAVKCTGAASTTGTKILVTTPIPAPFTTELGAADCKAEDTGACAAAGITMHCTSKEKTVTHGSIAHTKGGTAIHESTWAQASEGLAGSTATKHERTRQRKAAQNNSTTEHKDSPLTTVNVILARTPTPVPMTTEMNTAEGSAESNVAWAESGTERTATTTGKVSHKSTPSLADCTAISHDNVTRSSASNGDCSAEYNGTPNEVRTDTLAQLTTAVKTPALIQSTTETDTVDNTAEGALTCAMARTEHLAVEDITTGISLTHLSTSTDPGKPLDLGRKARSTAGTRHLETRSPLAMEPPPTARSSPTDLGSHPRVRDCDKRGAAARTETHETLTLNQGSRGNTDPTESGKEDLTSSAGIGTRSLTHTETKDATTTDRTEIRRESRTATATTTETSLADQELTPAILGTPDAERDTADSNPDSEYPKPRETSARTKLTNPDSDNVIRTVLDPDRDSSGTANRATRDTRYPDATVTQVEIPSTLILASTREPQTATAERRRTRLWTAANTRRRLQSQLVISPTGTDPNTETPEGDNRGIAYMTRPDSNLETQTPLQQERDTSGTTDVTKPGHIHLTVTESTTGASLMDLVDHSGISDETHQTTARNQHSRGNVFGKEPQTKTRAGITPTGPNSLSDTLETPELGRDPRGSADLNAIGGEPLTPAETNTGTTRTDLHLGSNATDTTDRAETGSKHTTATNPTAGNIPTDTKLYLDITVKHENGYSTSVLRDTRSTAVGTEIGNEITTAKGSTVRISLTDSDPQGNDRRTHDQGGDTRGAGNPTGSGKLYRIIMSTAAGVPAPDSIPKTSVTFEPGRVIGGITSPSETNMNPLTHWETECGIATIGTGPNLKLHETTVLYYAFRSTAATNDIEIGPPDIGENTPGTIATDPNLDTTDLSAPSKDSPEATHITDGALQVGTATHHGATESYHATCLDKFESNHAGTTTGPTEGTTWTTLNGRKAGTVTHQGSIESNVARKQAGSDQHNDSIDSNFARKTHGFIDGEIKWNLARRMAGRSDCSIETGTIAHNDRTESKSSSTTTGLTDYLIESTIARSLVGIATHDDLIESNDARSQEGIVLNYGLRESNSAHITAGRTDCSTESTCARSTLRTANYDPTVSNSPRKTTELIDPLIESKTDKSQAGIFTHNDRAESTFAPTTTGLMDHSKVSMRAPTPAGTFAHHGPTECYKDVIKNQIAYTAIGLFDCTGESMTAQNQVGIISYSDTTERNCACTMTGPLACSIQTGPSTQYDTAGHNPARSNTGPIDSRTESKVAPIQAGIAPDHNTIKSKFARRATGPIDCSIKSKAARMQAGRAAREDSIESNFARTNTRFTDSSRGSKAARLHTGTITYLIDSYLNRPTKSKRAPTRAEITTHYATIESYLAHSTTGHTKSTAESDLTRTKSETAEHIDSIKSNSARPIAGLDNKTEGRPTRSQGGIVTRYDSTKSNGAHSATAPSNCIKESRAPQRQLGFTQRIDLTKSKVARATERKVARVPLIPATEDSRIDSNPASTTIGPIGGPTESKIDRTLQGTTIRYGTIESNFTCAATGILDRSNERTRDRTQDRTGTHDGLMESTLACMTTTCTNCSIESRATPTQSGSNAHYDTAESTLARTATGPPNGSIGSKEALTQSGTTTYHGSTVNASAATSAEKVTADNPIESTSARSTDGTTESASAETSTEKGIEAEKATEDSTIAIYSASTKAGVHGSTTDRAGAQTIDGATIDNDLIRSTRALTTDKPADGASENTPAETPAEGAIDDCSIESTSARTIAYLVDSTTESSPATIAATNWAGRGDSNEHRKDGILEIARLPKHRRAPTN